MLKGFKEFALKGNVLDMALGIVIKRKEQAPPPVPTTKDCPHCFTAIPIKATR